MQCRHVMVIDDDTDIREGLMEALSIEGYDVYSASNGKDALDQLNHLDEEELPGCIFLDLNMPVMNGKRFLLEKEHQNRRLAEIPVCIASANTADENFEMDHIAEKLEKPFDLERLYDVVHHFCGDPSKTH